VHPWVNQDDQLGRIQLNGQSACGRISGECYGLPARRTLSIPRTDLGMWFPTVKI
jgi:hypothetical protein